MKHKHTFYKPHKKLFLKIFSGQVHNSFYKWKPHLKKFSSYVSKNTPTSNFKSKLTWVQVSKHSKTPTSLFSIRLLFELQLTWFSSNEIRRQPSYVRLYPSFQLKWPFSKSNLKFLLNFFVNCIMHAYIQKEMTNPSS